MIRVFQVAMNQPKAGQMVDDVLHSGYVGEGAYVKVFEHQFAELVGAREAPEPEPPVLAVNSCTSALSLALHLIGVRDRVVITTPMTCAATNNAIVSQGGRIAWADVDGVTGLITVDSVARRYYAARYHGQKVAAIVAVDWGGRVCDYSRLKDSGLPVVQDAAHSLGASIGGDYTAWSCGPIKHLTCGGTGGVLLVPDEQRRRARLLRWHGLDRLSTDNFRCEQDILEAGFRYHMTDVEASIGIANLEMIESILERHRANAAYYHEALAELPGVTLPPPDPSSAWWLYCLLIDRDRDGFMRFMAERGIETSRVHRRNDEHPAFRAACVNPDDRLPGVDYFDRHQVSIPVGWWLSRSERDRVAEAVRDWSRR